MIFILELNSDFPFSVLSHSCLTLFDPMDYSLPSSSVHGDSPGENTENINKWGEYEKYFKEVKINECL